MRKWIAAEIEELDINETAHERYGSNRDGGYVGDDNVGNSTDEEELS